MSKTGIVSIRDMIDAAFGDDHKNRVNFRTIQAILHILARELRVLDRRVEVPAMELPEGASSMSITEIKLLATKDQKGKGTFKRKIEKSSDRSRGWPSTAESEPSESVDRKADTTMPSSKKGLKATFERTSFEKSEEKSDSWEKSDKSEKSDTKRKKEAFTRLEEIEEQRERLLRVIDQRQDSREEPGLSVTPMKSISSTEVQQEKLLIIGRRPSKESTLTASRSERLSIVTKDQFEHLAKIVTELQNKFEIGTPTLPENAQLMKDLRKGASLTDAMSALQMSARLEAAEKTLQNMLSLVSDLAAKTPGVKISELKTQEKDDKSEAQVLLPHKTGKTAGPKKSEKLTVATPSTITATGVPSEDKNINKVTTLIDDAKNRPEFITLEQIYEAIDQMNSQINKLTFEGTNDTMTAANDALNLSKKLELKIGLATKLCKKFTEVENLVMNYTEKINALDTGLSSSMTNYQEQLTQMQHDLEMGLENMAEALANMNGDPVAVAELNGNFTALQLDIESTFTKQKILQEDQIYLKADIENIMKQIEILREAKSDRDEVTDALGDKAGIDALNGMVTIQQFGAVRGDLEKRIWNAYDKFNNQELVWQKAIDELVRELNEKADCVQVSALRDDVLHNLNMLLMRTKKLEDIVGEPNSSVVTRQIYRDTACLCCSTPANLAYANGDGIPLLPSLPTKSTNQDEKLATTPGDSGDDGKCYPGYTVPHQIDPRAAMCHRYCGGSHTVTTDKIMRVPPGVTLKSLKPMTPGLGTDGKLYLVDPPLPCGPCNKTPEPKIAAEAEPVAEIKRDEKFLSADYKIMTAATEIRGGETISNLMSMQQLNDFNDSL